MRLRLVSLLTAFTLLSTHVVVVSSVAAPVSDCRISVSPNQTVSLGFPIAPERINTKAKPKIMVLPFRLSDRPTFSFSENMKSDYEAAAVFIERYSRGLSKPEFVYAPVVDIPETVADMVILRQNQQQQWQRDEAKSTWGFIRKLIANSDDKIDFTGIDGVIMHGSSTSSDSWIAEAMMFSKNPRDPWFRTIKTAEGEILNAVLLDKHNSISTIAHEILHLYGLTDLYGTPTGPGNLSLMASNADALLSYEKWVLGWFPENQVQCIVEATEIKPTQVSTRIKIPNSNTDQIVVINSDVSGQAMIIETYPSGTSTYLAFYSLSNEARPPITMHTPQLGLPGSGLIISNTSGVGAQLLSPKYNLLVSDKTTSEITLDLIPKGQLPNASALISAAEANRARIQQETASQVDSASTKPKSNKKSIVCVKGKTVRKISAVKPKCPSGFNRR